uniref:CRIB domain-containing protein RIC4-like n=1 Tax=Erigeron canadensis TaxID=72917 RepID=UPI001CB8A781|nr:CRIB domain-containing protein RIC4-like [Erigeron canadensis]
MNDIMSRIYVLPFNIGCLSKSTTRRRNTKIEPSQVATRVDLEGDKKRSSSPMVKIKKSWHSVAPSRSYMSKAMDRVIRVTCKGFNNIFAYKDMEDVKVERKREMEIGFPTDVKHVTHIGYDGSTTTNPENSWDHFQPSETLSSPSVSLKQLELAFAGQRERQDP